MTEQDIRVQILNSFLMTPHGKLADLAPLHTEAIARDPLFYGHLAVWYRAHGEVRDHQALFVAHLLTSPEPEHRAAGWVLLQDLPPHQVATAVDHAKQHIGKLPRTFKGAVTAYLRTLEVHPGRFDRATMRSRASLKHLYATLRIKPSPRAQAILFVGDPPEESQLRLVKTLAQTSDPEEQALQIIVHRIPYTTAVGALRKLTPSVLVALIDVMTPQEVINHLKALKRHGALANDETRQMVEAKLRAAKDDQRVSTLKATRALAHVDLDDATKAALVAATDQRVAQIARIERPTALFVDKSGSMTAAIELAKEVAAMISAICADFRVLAFDTGAFALTAEGATRSAWEAAFAQVQANGGTSIGAPLAKLAREGQRVEEIVIITDSGENTPPYFRDAYTAYAQALGVMPHVTIVEVGGSNPRFVRDLVERWVPVTTWTFGGDYYSLPNLLPLLALPTRADLVEEIMALPLPSRAVPQAS
jgi:hypothetical protein